jgi:hypothetical protein
MFSGGEGSYRAAKIDRLCHPDAEFGLVFTDVLYEDADTYRFLIEAAADVLGRRLNWTVKAEDFPDYRVGADVPIEEYAGNPEWRAYLADLRLRTMDALPELVWLAEGRDPWEVFRDRRFIGNSQVDLCSRIGKREIADDWRIANCNRIGELFGAPDLFAMGIGFDERQRFDDGQGGGIGPRNLSDGWIYHAPLIDAEIAVNAGSQQHMELLFAPIETFGLRRQSLYGFNYKHGNCGGFCIKAGHAHYQNRFIVQPERFAYDAMMERKLIAFLGVDVSILTDRRGGDGKKPMTLDAFADRLRADPTIKYEYLPGEGGCGCTTALAA